LCFSETGKPNFRLFGPALLGAGKPQGRVSHTTARSELRKFFLALVAASAAAVASACLRCHHGVFEEPYNAAIDPTKF
jgi:hypothetical protein